MRSSSSAADGDHPPCDGRWKVLVVGDWIVDEDWVVAPEDSSTSALQPNERHFLTTFDQPSVGTKRLCGTALTASAIRSFCLPDGAGGWFRPFDVYGLGVWHPSDSAYLEHLFQTDTLEGANPFRISRPRLRALRRSERRLHNLATDGDDACTTRIVRTFVGHPGTLPVPMSRYDWHAPWRPAKIPGSMQQFLISRLNAAIREMGVDGFDAVVLADFSKGLVTQDLLGALASTAPRRHARSPIRWYFRSKSVALPQWNQELDRVLDASDSLLRFFDPRTSSRLAAGRRFIFGNRLTREGLDLVVEETRLERVEDAQLMLTFQDNSALCYDTRGREAWVLRSSEKPPPITRGRSSIVLGGLVVDDFLARDPRYGQDYRIESFGGRAASAMVHGQNWCRNCSSVWKSGRAVRIVSAGITGAVNLPIDRGPVQVHGPTRTESLMKEWDQATKEGGGCCIKSSDGVLELEVWRAHTTLNDYTVLEPKRKETVLALRNSIATFLAAPEDRRQRPSFSLVQAGPGSGKTFLAKCLSREFGLKLFEFNLAQASGLDDLSLFFDQVDLAMGEGVQPLVFIDEVDNPVAGASAYGYLLDLMWCGHYNRNGLRRTMRPFPGLLAMSTEPMPNQGTRKGENKFPDLRSRIYGTSCKLQDFTQAEKIYLFAKLLERYVGQVAYVELGVLRCVAATELAFGPRSLELLISLLQGISRNTVTRAALPPLDRIKDLTEHFPKLLSDEYTKPGGDKRVRMVYTAPDRG